MEQVFFNVPLSKLEPIIKKWFRESLAEQQISHDAHAHNEALSVQDAAQFLRISPSTVYSKVSKGELPVMKRGNRLYFSRSDLVAYLKAGRKPLVSKEEAHNYLKT